MAAHDPAPPVASAPPGPEAPGPRAPPGPAEGGSPPPGAPGAQEARILPRVGRVLFVEEAAPILRLSVPQLRDAIRRGDVRARRVGRRYLIAERALENLLLGGGSEAGSGCRSAGQYRRRGRRR